jgi:hypothetical protein
MKRAITLAVISMAAVLASGTQARVSEEEAKRLETDLTPIGAERAGNADGTIPAWTGAMMGAPENLNYGGDGSPLPDPYADEKPLFSITAANMDQYAEHLTEGVKALFKLRPDTFRMDVYPSHRDGGYPQIIIDRARWNATRTELANDGEVVVDWTGGTAFPIPENGIEVMWNGRSGGISNPTQVGEFEDVSVFASGVRTIFGVDLTTNFLYADRSIPVGTTEKDTGSTLFKTFAIKTAPPADKGAMNLVHDPIDYTTAARLAWTYIPGTRRVRQAPNLGFDTPVGPGGLQTADDINGFNGAFKKFDWQLIGKKEMYIPYHNYSFDDESLDYDTLLPVGHPNPDYWRFEKHRVWVVDATLKPGERHLYGRRVFYLDEDSWAVIAADNYDNRGEIYRAGLINSLYHYAMQYNLTRGQVYFDLTSGHYIVSRLSNKTGQARVMDEMKKEEFYTPSNLRRQGRR